MGKTFKDNRYKESMKKPFKNKKVYKLTDELTYVCQSCGSVINTTDDWAKCPRCGGMLLPK